MNECNSWLNRLCNLNVAKSEKRGRAPHKPLLLLCIRHYHKPIYTISEVSIKFRCFTSTETSFYRYAPIYRPDSGRGQSITHKSKNANKINDINKKPYD